MNAADVSALPDYTDPASGVSYVIVGWSKADERRVVEARFWQKDDAERAIRSMRRAHPWRVYELVEVGS